MADENKHTPLVALEPYEEMVRERAPELFCDACGHYPIEPVHGHFVCPACHMPTKCCEGAPIEA